MWGMERNNAQLSSQLLWCSHKAAQSLYPFLCGWHSLRRTCSRMNSYQSHRKFFLLWISLRKSLTTADTNGREYAPISGQSSRLLKARFITSLDLKDSRLMRCPRMRQPQEFHDDPCISLLPCGLGYAMHPKPSNGSGSLYDTRETKFLIKRVRY